MNRGKEKISRLRFSADDDICLLREFVGQNPIANPEKWYIVQANLEQAVRKKFQIRTLKQHVQLLLELWMKKEYVAKILSGAEEPYSEKDVLLQEISNICDEYGGSIKKKRVIVSKEKKISEIGRNLREKLALEFSDNIENDDKIEIENIITLQDHDYNNFTTGDTQTENTDSSCTNIAEILEVTANENVQPGPSLSQSSKTNPIAIAPEEPQKKENRNVSGPIKRKINKNRTLRKNALEYLTEKNEREYKTRLKELDIEERKVAVQEKKNKLEERRLAIEENKMELQSMEMKEKIAIEKERFQLELTERKLTNSLMESQQKIIDSLLKKIECLEK